MRAVLYVVMALGLGVVGCGNNDCEDAVDKLAECGIELGSEAPTEDETSECDSHAECKSKCINDASCADLKALPDSLRSCLDSCD